MFHGTLTALVTPFRNGYIDEDAFRAHLDRQIEAGVDGVVPAGSTGEAATLSHEEHKRLIRMAVDHVAGRVPVVAGAGSNSTSETIELTRAAKEAGADAALLISPYYNKPTQEGIYQHYKAAAEAVHLPIFLYNVPGRTASNIAPETVGRLSAISNVVGIKDATADMDQLVRTMACCDGSIEFFSGDDATVAPFMSLGGKGVISVVSNIAPEAMKNITEFALQGDAAKATSQQKELARLNEMMFVQSNPIPVKAACAMLGWMGWELRLPLTILPATEREALFDSMEAFGLTPEIRHP
ncbi:MAG: 4-hydroxy-tetrahydrodipicolinate synthase [Mariprofundaceae bacterium]